MQIVDVLRGEFASIGLHIGDGPADGFPAVSKGFQLAADSEKGTDIGLGCFAQAVLVEVVEEVHDFVFDSVGNFLILHQLLAEWLILFPTVGRKQGIVYMFQPVLHYFAEMADFLVGLGYGQLRGGDQTIVQIFDSVLILFRRSRLVLYDELDHRAYLFREPYHYQGVDEVEGGMEH